MHFLTLYDVQIRHLTQGSISVRHSQIPAGSNPCVRPYLVLGPSAGRRHRGRSAAASARIGPTGDRRHASGRCGELWMVDELLQRAQTRIGDSCRVEALDRLPSSRTAPRTTHRSCAAAVDDALGVGRKAWIGCKFGRLGLSAQSAPTRARSGSPMKTCRPPLQRAVRSDGGVAGTAARWGVPP